MFENGKKFRKVYLLYENFHKIRPKGNVSLTSCATSLNECLKVRHITRLMIINSFVEHIKRVEFCNFFLFFRNNVQKKGTEGQF